MVKGTLSSKDRREQEKLATRNRILEAAREMFNEYGVEATTMRAIADRIGYTATAIYYHFKDKDALLLELCHRDFSQLGRVIALSAQIADPIERLRATGRAYVDFAFANPSQYRFMFMSHARPMNPEDIANHGNPEEDAYAFLILTIDECLAKGCFRPEYTSATEIANMCWAAPHGVISLYFNKSHDQWVEWGDVKALAYRMIDTTLHGLTAK